MVLSITYRCRFDYTGLHHVYPAPARVPSRTLPADPGGAVCGSGSYRVAMSRLDSQAHRSSPSGLFPHAFPVRPQPHLPCAAMRQRGYTHCARGTIVRQGCRLETNVGGSTEAIPKWMKLAVLLVAASRLGLHLGRPTLTMQVYHPSTMGPSRYTKPGCRVHIRCQMCRLLC